MFDDVLSRLGLRAVNSGVCGASWIERPGGSEIVSINPATAAPIARVLSGSEQDYDRVVDDARQAFLAWRTCRRRSRGGRPSDREGSPRAKGRPRAAGHARDRARSAPRGRARSRR